MGYLQNERDQSMTNSKVARVPVSKEKECFSTSSGNLNYRRTYIRLQVKVLPRQDLGGNTYLPSPPRPALCSSMVRYPGDALRPADERKRTQMESETENAY